MPDPSCPDGYRFGSDAPRPGACASVDPVANSSGLASSTADPTVTSTTAEATTLETATTSTNSGGGVVDETTTTEGVLTTSTSDGCGPLGCACTESIAVGNQYSCLERSDGAIVCWGRNNHGQAGVVVAEIPQVNDPTVVSIPVPSTDVEAQFEHSCAIDVDGRVWCWGRNLSGCVDPVNAVGEATGPVQVEGVENIVELRLAYRSTCGIRDDGQLVCWGNNSFGQRLTELRGFGPHVVPLPIEGMVDLRLGEHHGCAWNDDHVVCWGRNNHGQLAAPAAIETSSSPVAIDLPAAPLSVAAGRNHNCALLDDHSVHCWGSNINNAISEAKMPAYRTPVAVPQPWKGMPTEVVALRDTTCAKLGPTDLWCWGQGFGGYLGVEGGVNNAPLWPPQRIAAIDELTGTVVQTGLGYQHMCARLDSAEVFCWGNTTIGQLGPMLPPNGMLTVQVNPCGT